MPQKLDFENALGKKKGVVIFKHVELRLALSAPENKLIQEIKELYYVYCYVGFKNGINSAQAAHCDGIICERYVMPDSVLQNTHWIRLSGYNFIDPRFFIGYYDVKEKNNKPVRTLLYVGNTQRRKNVFEFLKIAFHLKSTFKCKYDYIVVLNDDDKRHSKFCLLAIRLLIAISGEAHNGHHLGEKLTTHSLREVMSHADLLYHPSTLEGAARICAEALCLGLPVAISPKCRDGTRNLLAFETVFEVCNKLSIHRFFESEAPHADGLSNEQLRFFDAEKSFDRLIRLLEEACQQKLSFYSSEKVGFLPCHTNRYSTYTTRKSTDECFSLKKIGRFARDELSVTQVDSYECGDRSRSALLVKSYLHFVVDVAWVAVSFVMLAPLAISARWR